MSEKIPHYEAPQSTADDDGEFEWVDTPFQTFEDFRDVYLAGAYIPQATKPAHRPQPVYEQPQYAPAPLYTPAQQASKPHARSSEAPLPPSPKRIHKRHRGLAIAAIPTGLIIAAGAVFAVNPGNIQGLIGIGDKAAAKTSSDTGLLVNPLLAANEATFSTVNGECMKPENVVLVSKASFNLPVIALLNSTKVNPPPAAAAKVKQYLTQEKADQYSNKSDQAKIEKLITPSGFSEVIVQGITFTYSVCEIPKSGAITDKAGVVTGINRGGFEIHVRDPNGIFGVELPSKSQTDSFKNPGLDPSKNEFVSFPRADLDIDKTKKGDANYDPILNTSIDAVTTAMSTQQQQQVLFQTMETQFVQQTDRATPGQANIMYTGNSKILRDELDAVITKRLGGTTNNPPSFTGEDYVFIMDLPNDKTTKNPLINSVPLKNIATDQTIRLNSVVYTPGSVSPPKVTATPTPSPTPTAKLAP